MRSRLKSEVLVSTGKIDPRRASAMPQRTLAAHDLSAGRISAVRVEGEKKRSLVSRALNVASIEPPARYLDRSLVFNAANTNGRFKKFSRPKGRV
jgi:hypothetical protein